MEKYTALGTGMELTTVRRDKDGSDLYSGYTLELMTEGKLPGTENVRIEIDGYMCVTGRDLEEYHPPINKLIINPRHQYVEVGAGLGEFTPKVVEMRGNSSDPKPIVIDPLDYELVHGLLDYAHKTFSKRWPVIGKTLKGFIDHCETITDPKKVNLINLPLEEALKRHPMLYGIADVVVDNYGLAHYAVDSDKDAILKQEKALLKPGGILLSEKHEEGECKRFTYMKEHGEALEH